MRRRRLTCSCWRAQVEALEREVAALQRALAEEVLLNDWYAAQVYMIYTHVHVCVCVFVCVCTPPVFHRYI